MQFAVPICFFAYMAAVQAAPVQLPGEIAASPNIAQPPPGVDDHVPATTIPRNEAGHPHLALLDSDSGHDVELFKGPGCIDRLIGSLDLDRESDARILRSILRAKGETLITDRLSETLGPTLVGTSDLDAALAPLEAPQLELVEGLLGCVAGLTENTDPQREDDAWVLRSILRDWGKTLVFGRVDKALGHILAGRSGRELPEAASSFGAPLEALRVEIPGIGANDPTAAAKVERPQASIRPFDWQMPALTLTFQVPASLANNVVGDTLNPVQ
ncbi:hypothetical protein BKA70DRAFT_1575821 [Coprinopsis sp. MPI-PUGE-AT-0042]|nr:hypothetical protein BKA70DRAFT_1575821 [Coprinopsis sp. MPI-PUGE-AT-0042]